MYARIYKFPDRETDVGKMIDLHLKGKLDQKNDNVINQLFAINRWEIQ